MNPEKIKIFSRSPAQTRAVGTRLGEALFPRACVALTGPLGAGKTEFVKGVAAGLGTPTDIPVNSPTFVIVNEYPGRLHLYHLDAYRLTGPDDLLALGFDDMLTGENVVLVEWADRATEALPEDRIVVAISHTEGHTRDIIIEATGKRSRDTLMALRDLGERTDEMPT
jgi:tRNA threonylcarbamoyladenosine biosynthesis protein TsaE